MVRTRRLHARLAYVTRLHERLSYVVRVDDRVSIAHVAVVSGHAGRVKSGRVVHRCIRSACRSRRCVGLCSVVVAVLADSAIAVLVALKVHPATIAGNPKARGKTTARLPRARSAWTV